LASKKKDFSEIIKDLKYSRAKGLKKSMYVAESHQHFPTKFEIDDSSSDFA